MTRRETLKSVLLAVAALGGAPGAAIARGGIRMGSGGSPLRGPIFNQDDSEFFSTRDPSEVSGEAVDAWVDGIAAAGVGTLMSCVCAMRTNYASRAWEPRWTGYDPQGPDDQPVLAHLPRESVPGTRRWLESETRLAELGINFHERAFARCKQRGIAAWASIRMNDLHDCHLPDSPLLSGFYKSQRGRGLLRAQYRPGGWPELALDWGRAEVRDHYMRLVREVLSFRGIEGLELDWMRFGFHFRIGRELEGGEILTDWVGRVRKLCDEAAEREGHPVRLGCRVPSDPNTARMLGLDGVLWASKGLVDLLVPTPFWETCEFNMPMRTWAWLLEGTGCALAGGLEIRYQPFRGAPATMMTPELAVGAATAVLAGGAGHVYLFNYFAKGHLDNLWTRESFNRTLSAMGSLQALDEVPRRHAITFRDIMAPGEPGESLLPVGGAVATFRLQTGPKPEGRKVHVVLELEEKGDAEPAAPDVRVNSVPCPTPRRQTRCVVIYAVPEEALAEGETVIEAFGAGAAIVRVEVVVAGATARGRA